MVLLVLRYLPDAAVGVGVQYAGETAAEPMPTTHPNNPSHPVRWNGGGRLVVQM